MTARGEQTRERILDAAEQLWGARGVDAVSLREIRLAAGQRNSSALQFHFGDRDGLLLALSHRHLPRLAAIQQAQHDALVADGRGDDIVGLVDVFVRPSATYLRTGPSARAWTKVAAEMSARPEIAIGDVLDHAEPIALHIGGCLHQHLATVLPPDVALARLLAVSQTGQHLCADRARIEDAGPTAARRRVLPFDVWADDLVAMATGALLAGAPAPLLR